ncbi:MAG: hypothetical protein COT85_04110 [Chlamydiae bacterium CG10_big_fil_rev_8_21_14_0_10_42_34]|nr:MAG: hypothetical protein COT85_04110 [Chlamydiae bacterium CG10_big_fil_rev_8_21_14_0_10_42_34]
MIRQIFFFLSLFNLAFTEELGWQASEFIWDFGVILSCDKGLTQCPKQYFAKDQFDPSSYAGIQKGDIVWVKSCFIKQFYKKVLPHVKNRFVLVISDGDESFPSNSHLGKHLDRLIKHKMIGHIFAQNCDYQGSSSKVSHLPIGVDFHTMAYKEGVSWGAKASPQEQEQALKEVLNELKPTSLRKKRAFVDFQHSNTMNGSFNREKEFGENRATIFETLKNTGLIDYGNRMARLDLWKTKGQYAFSISPHGNGLDCHRTWEDLILGCIVIVKTSPLDPLYKDLPVVIVKNWEEITEENLQKWLDQYKDAFTNPSFREKLTNAYWLNKIKKAAKTI